MSTLHASVIDTLRRWQPPTDDQRSLREAYLGFALARPDACDRTCAPGHFTASCVVLDAEARHVALVHHGLAKCWIVPGGHLEVGDASVAAAAAREVREELGLEVELDPHPLDLDCHAFTCRNSPPTRHYDVCFVGRAAPGAELVCSEESGQVRWWPVDAVPADVERLPELVAMALRRVH